MEVFYDIIGILALISRNLVTRVPDVNKNMGVADTAPLRSITSSQIFLHDLWNKSLAKSGHGFLIM